MSQVVGQSESRQFVEDRLWNVEVGMRNAECGP